MTTAVSHTPYRVLAVKYRPKKLDDMIGQTALVQTLNNAFANKRMAHAYLLTGVRGVGKTTTARVIARGLNCIGVDGQGGPTPNPCGQCIHCQQIDDDRHLDVMEVDAASRTGVDDMREIIDGVRFHPTSARYKIYIIDEVHMLSKNAFNALLKTLEEPPPHVVFIFATTEIRKVPITVLSRCQRFDLKRVGVDELAPYYQHIAQLEGWTLDDAAAQLLAHAADGSVRDGLSLLDRAANLVDGAISADVMQGMLGLIDPSRMHKLLTDCLAGQSSAALEQLNGLYAQGAEARQILEDLARAVHQQTLQAAQQRNSQQLAQLSRCWQILTQAISDLSAYRDTHMATEMALIHLCFASQLPTPSELINSDHGSTPLAPPQTLSTPPANESVEATNKLKTSSFQLSPPNALTVAPSAASTTHQPTQTIHSFHDLIELISNQREMLLAQFLRTQVELVDWAPPRVQFFARKSPDHSMMKQLHQLLNKLTGQSWLFEPVEQRGQPPVTEQIAQAKQQALVEAAENPDIASALSIFPGAKLTRVENIS